MCCSLYLLCCCRPRGGGGSDLATPHPCCRPLIPAPDPTPAAPPPPQDGPIAPQGPGQLALLCSQTCVWCHVFVCVIGGISALCVFLVWFCVGMRVGLVICLCGVVLGVFLCNEGVLGQSCLFLVVFYSVSSSCISFIRQLTHNFDFRTKIFLQIWCFM